MSDPRQQNMSEPRPRLIPVRVPWQIESTEARLSLLASEIPEDPTEIVSYARILTRSAASAFELHVIKIRFRGARAARLVPGDGSLPFNPLAYDHSALPSMSHFWSDPHKAIRQLEDEWRHSGLAPDPGFYQVFPSSWMEELCIDEEAVRHYLTVGGTAVVDVLAEGWDWRTEECLGSAPPRLP